jgi:cyanamide hydratase family protein with HD domain
MALLQNHGLAGIAQPAPPGLVESFFLSCVLHDIGTAPANIGSTRLSFELWGAVEALRVLPAMGASADQAELVAEVISRHQDLGDTGRAPAVLGLIYFATIFGEVFVLAPECKLTASRQRRAQSRCRSRHDH